MQRGRFADAQESRYQATNAQYGIVAVHVCWFFKCTGIAFQAAERSDIEVPFCENHVFRPRKNHIWAVTS